MRLIETLSILQDIKEKLLSDYTVDGRIITDDGIFHGLDYTAPFFYDLAKDGSAAESFRNEGCDDFLFSITREESDMFNYPVYVYGAFMRIWDDGKVEFNLLTYGTYKSISFWEKEKE